MYGQKQREYVQVALLQPSQDSTDVPEHFLSPHSEARFSVQAHALERVSRSF